MKKTFFLIFLVIISAAGLFLPVSAASDVIVAVAEAEDGKSLRKLEAGDVINVRVVLPEMDEVRKLQFDLVFDPDVVSYNGDAKPDSNAAGFDIISVGEVTEQGDALPAVRFLAGASSPVTFSGGSTSFSASFTVKEDAPRGQSDAFSLGGLNCDDDSVSLDKSRIKITVGEAETQAETEETTAPPEIEDESSIIGAVVVACFAAVLVIAVVLAVIKIRGKRRQR